MSVIGKRHHNGFTLIEALVVVAIVGLISGIGYPSLRSAMRAQEFGAGQSSVTLALKETRAAAISGGRAARLVVSPGGQSVSVDGHVRPPLAAALRLASLQNRAIVFYADGTSNGGKLTLNGDNRRTDYVIYPTTGFIAVTAQ
ncbi:MAG: Tfp pilus assembly protein FimT/FimU [Sphingomonadaceae bacterium]